MLRYAFGALSARIIKISHAEGNEASRWIIEKLGFSYESLWHFDHEMPDGTLVDAYEYYRTGLDGLPPLDVRW